MGKIFEAHELYFYFISPPQHPSYFFVFILNDISDISYNCLPIIYAISITIKQRSVFIRGAKEWTSRAHAQSRSNTIIKRPCLRSIEPRESRTTAKSIEDTSCIPSPFPRGELKLSWYEVQRYQDLNKSTAQVSDRSQQVGHVLPPPGQVGHSRRAEPEALSSG